MHMYTNLKNEDGVSPFSYPRPAHFLENDLAAALRLAGFVVALVPEVRPMKKILVTS